MLVKGGWGRDRVAERKKKRAKVSVWMDGEADHA